MFPVVFGLRARTAFFGFHLWAASVHALGTLNPRVTTATRLTSSSSSSSSLASASSVSTESVTQDGASSITKPAVPMTLLAGFLGTGKTTTLKHLLENTDNVKIGVIVNDVAAVNIDAKLVKAGQTADDMVELQNGCACCSLADELFFSVERLLQDRNFDALVVELSGVADPMAIRNNWKMAPSEIRQMANIQKVVTVLDSQTFGSDYMTWDMVTDRQGWAERSDACAVNHKVSQLLAEQVEAADLVLLNKVDLASEEQVQVATKVVRALNDKAEFVKVSFGNVSPKQVLVDNNIEEEAQHEHAHAHDHHDDDCDAVAHDHHSTHEEEESSSHSHAHDHASSISSESSPDHSSSHESSSSHSHSHDHAAVKAEEEAKSSHSHSHDHSHEETHNSHSHSHDHGEDEEACTDPTCTDTSHSHSHSHATSIDTLGISNFVFRATRPFATRRMLALLNRWPIPDTDVLDLEFLQQGAMGPEGLDMFGNSAVGNPFVGVLRTKGFCWFAPNRWEGVLEDSWRHDAAMYMSHAGRHMGVNPAGKWWATIPKETLPNYFEDDNRAELDRILREDFVTEEFGDRRQEIVFIGVDIDVDAIQEALNNCLLSDDEMTEYREQLGKRQAMMEPVSWVDRMP